MKSLQHFFRSPQIQVKNQMFLNFFTIIDTLEIVTQGTCQRQDLDQYLGHIQHLGHIWDIFGTYSTFGTYSIELHICVVTSLY